MKLLWIEDEHRVREEGALFLKREGFEVEAVGSYAEALSHLERGDVSLLILDWMLPDLSGLEICKEVQQKWRIPVLMLTAKSDEFDKVLALEIGADDYLTKPFGQREFIARVKAILRRMNKWEGVAEPDTSDILLRGDLRIDLERHEIWKRGELVSLTPTEFAFLYTLAKSPGRVYSRLNLLDDALGSDFVGFERTIDSHIRNLRRKIEDDVGSPRFILTVYGVGYKFGDVT